jgi:putative mRNA 3-end processing factor
MAYLNAMRPEELLAPTPSGVCCKPGNFFIDPTRPVDKAVIRHGHSDHARPGHGAVLATQETLDMMRLRYGKNFADTTQAVCYGETLTLGGATAHHALSPHQPAALGQATARGRPAGSAGADAGRN